MFCQQNVKTTYFKTVNPRLFISRQWFEVRFFFVVICKCCKFSTSLLGSCKREFWMALKISNSRRMLNNNNRDLKNHDDDFVDNDRKWDTVHCASAISKFRRRGVVDDAKHSRITSSCNPQASAGITPCF